MKYTKYFHFVVGSCFISLLYGFDYQAAVKVNQPKTAEVLAVAERIIESASKLHNNPLDRLILENMVAAAFSDENIEVGQLVDFDVLAQKIKAGGDTSQSTRLANSELL